MKEDTTEMRPLVARMDTKTDKIEEQIIGNIMPWMSKSDDTFKGFSKGVKFLVKEAEYQKRLKSEISVHVTSPDYIKNAVDIVYENNAKLQLEIRELKQENTKLKMEIQSLDSRLEQYQEETRNVNYVQESQDEEWEQ